MNINLIIPYYTYKSIPMYDDQQASPSTNIPNPLGRHQLGPGCAAAAPAKAAAGPRTWPGERKS